MTGQELDKNRTRTGQKPDKAWKGLDKDRIRTGQGLDKNWTRTGQELNDEDVIIEPDVFVISSIPCLKRVSYGSFMIED
ncbi:hypothetical protein Bpfe_013115 [Biomphalaria pfeifferi]|uniref:Uncharacterized protein n=1 Tax=Biomphalaria pfeifferi TaxID=112525 RepID=A0AAD8BNG6_BIOPF|nr:hypothetical protein Bpfe_013115 [Biomphalaria pfeifferi]